MIGGKLEAVVAVEVAPHERFGKRLSGDLHLARSEHHLLHIGSPAHRLRRDRNRGLYHRRPLGRRNVDARIDQCRGRALLG